MQLPVSWLLLLHLWKAAVDCEQKLLWQLLQLLLLLLLFRLLLQLQPLLQLLLLLGLLLVGASCCCCRGVVQLLLLPGACSRCILQDKLEAKGVSQNFTF